MINAEIVPIPAHTPDRIVGGNIKFLMWNRDIQQATLAGRLGVDQSTLSLKLKGKRKWTVEELINVSQFFGVTIDWLVHDRDAGGPVVGPEGLEPPASAV